MIGISRASPQYCATMTELISWGSHSNTQEYSRIQQQCCSFPMSCQGVMAWQSLHPSLTPTASPLCSGSVRGNFCGAGAQISKASPTVPSTHHAVQLELLSHQLLLFTSSWSQKWCQGVFTTCLVPAPGTSPVFEDWLLWAQQFNLLSEHWHKCSSPSVNCSNELDFIISLSFHFERD